MREFFKYHFFKVLLGIVVLQLLFFYWLEKRDHRPVAVTDEVSVYEGHTVDIRPLQNDNDKDEDQIILKDVDDPLHGKFKLEGDKLVYVAARDFAGVDSFAYTISDGKKISEKAFIKVTVNENLKPVANNDLVELYQGGKATLAVLGNDEDREGDLICIDQFSEPVHGNVEKKDNLLVYKPDKYYTGKDSFRYVINDGFNPSEKATVSISVKGKNDPCYPWLSADVGHPAKPGSLTCEAMNSYTVTASGNDIWGRADHFHWAWQVLAGDCEITARVTRIDDTDPWAKAGIMIRETLNSDSKNAYIAVSSGNGATFQNRTDDGGETQSSIHGEGVKAPYWVKLVRKDDRFTGFSSPDGKEWTEVGNTSVNMPGEVYLGLAVTSHHDGTLCTAIFDRTTVQKK